MTASGGGLECPRCGSTTSGVVDTRTGAGFVRRRRQCAAGHRYTTREVIVHTGRRAMQPGFRSSLASAVSRAVLDLGAGPLPGPGGSRNVSG